MATVSRRRRVMGRLAAAVLITVLAAVSIYVTATDKSFTRGQMYFACGVAVLFGLMAIASVRELRSMPPD